MPYNPHKHHRRSIRLKGYDYSQAGLYFITICVQDRKCLFGEIVNSEMILNDAGKMVENEWLKIPQRFTNVQLHEYMVMPNHFHSIMEILSEKPVVAYNGTDTGTGTIAQNDDFSPTNPIASGGIQGQPKGFAPTDNNKKPKTVGDMVGAFQSIVTVEYIRGVKQLGWTPFNGKLWQRNYWEHIIRDEPSCFRISNYIINNPKNWTGDKFHN